MDALTRRAIDELAYRVAQLPHVLALRVARALAVVGDTHGGADGEHLRRHALDLQKRLEGPEGD